MDGYKCGSFGRRARSRRLIGTAVVILLATSLSGCWLQIGNGPSNTRFNALEDKLTIDNVGSLAVSWETDIDSSLSEPIVLGNRIYMTTLKRSEDLETMDVMAVQAYDRGSGELVWETSLLPDGVQVQGWAGSVVLVEDALWLTYEHDALPECTRTLMRLDPANGEILSSEQTDATTDPIVASGQVLAQTAFPACGSSPQLVLRDVTSMEPLWTHTFPDGFGGFTTPTISNGKVFVVAGDSPDYALHAFDAAGCGADVCDPLWVQDDIEGLHFERPVAGPHGTVFVIGEGFDGEVDKKRIVAINAATGIVDWQTELRHSTDYPTALTGLAVANGTLYASGHLGEDLTGEIDGTLDAYPADGCGEPTCAPEWSVPLGVGVRATTAPTVAGGVVYVGRQGGPTTPAVVAVDASGCGEATCEPVASVTLADIVNLPSGAYRISVAGGRVYAVFGYPSGFPTVPDSALFSLAPTAP